MEWNGRQYRPIGRQVRNTKPDYKEMIKPYGQKENNGNVWIPVLSIPGNVPQPSSGPSPFDPSSITGLKLWFDADDNSTLLLDGNYVESWTSKGDVPMVLTASTINRRPQYITTGGTGSSPAVLMLSSSTAANRSLLTQASTSQSFNLTQGYTIFMAQKNAGSKSATGTYGSFRTYFYTYGSSSVFTSQNILIENQGNSTEAFQTGTTAGYQLNFTSPGSGTRYYWTPSPYIIKYVAMDYTDMGVSKIYGQDIYSGSPTLTSSSYPTGVTSFSGKTISGMGIGGVNNTGTPSVISNLNEEVYEILVYDTKLSTNDANQVMDYLRTKWDYVVDLSNTAVFDATVTGKTTNASDFFWFSNFNSPISAVGNFYWTTQGMKFLLDGNTDAYFNTGLVTANLGFNYSVSDSGNNIIETATCQKTSTGAILYSAGTYNISIEYDYNCVDPSPTPTPTETITPSPTPTMTPTPSSVPFDSDAAAYLSAVVSAGGSVNATISGATNTLFTSLKSASLYSKLSYMYPLIGSTPNSMKIEAKSLSATYDILFVSSGGTFTTNGYNPYNGSSYYYAQFTNVFGNSISPSGNIHMGLYITLAATGNNSGYGLCASDGNNSNQNYIFTKFNNGNSLFYSWVGAYTTTLSDPSGLGHYILTRNASNTNTQLYKNGSVIADVSQGYYACTTSYFLGAEIANGVAVGGRNSQTYSFVHFGNKLDASEQLTLSTIINTFQTTLGRNTY